MATRQRSTPQPLLFGPDGYQAQEAEGALTAHLEPEHEAPEIALPPTESESTEAGSTEESAADQVAQRMEADFEYLPDAESGSRAEALADALAAQVRTSIAGADTAICPRRSLKVQQGPYAKLIDEQLRRRKAGEPKSPLGRIVESAVWDFLTGSAHDSSSAVKRPKAAKGGGVLVAIEASAQWWRAVAIWCAASGWTYEELVNAAITHTFRGGK